MLFRFATASNIRDSYVSWDLWFNTRLTADAKIYIPVENAQAVRAQNNNQNPTVAALEFDINRFDLNQVLLDRLQSNKVELNKIESNNFAVLTLSKKAFGQGQDQREGKLLIQPRQGWMAAFTKGQLLVMKFNHLPLSSIHPEQGQVEIYVNYLAGAQAEGLIEMEIHGAYQTLAPAEQMTLTASWLLIAYNGLDTEEGRLEFLQQVLTES